jgi:hypothetical protein
MTVRQDRRRRVQRRLSAAVMQAAVPKGKQGGSGPGERERGEGGQFVQRKPQGANTTFEVTGAIIRFHGTREIRQ